MPNDSGFTFSAKIRYDIVRNARITPVPIIPINAFIHLVTRYPWAPPGPLIR